MFWKAHFMSGLFESWISNDCFVYSRVLMVIYCALFFYCCFVWGEVVLFFYCSKYI